MVAQNEGRLCGEECWKMRTRDSSGWWQSAPATPRSAKTCAEATDEVRRAAGDGAVGCACYGLSERRVCWLGGIGRSMPRYRSHARSEEASLRRRPGELVAARPCFDSRRLHVLRRAEAIVNH
jgi:hypothetical protein